MTMRLLAGAFMAALAAGIPAPAFAVAILDHFSIDGIDLTASLPPATTVGTRTSVNVARTNFTDATGHTFSIQSAKAGVNPTIFGDDSALDQIGFTDALITYTGGTGVVDLSIAYGFEFSPVTVNTQTYGIQIAGAFKRGFGLATGDRVNVSSSVVYDFSGNEGSLFENQIATSRVFSVVTSNTFGPQSPSSATEVISCSANIPSSQVCSSFDFLQTLAVMHFAAKGDSLRIPNSFLAVRGEDPDAVQAFLDAAAAADAAELGVPEPSSLVLLLGPGLAGLGLSRLKHAHRRADKGPRD